MSDKGTPPPCAGFVLWSRHPSLDAVVLVQDLNGNWGFPKGKRDRGESVLANALRELREETGLAEEDLLLVEGISCDENSPKGNLAVRYLTAWVLDASRPLVRRPDEHLAVEWVPYDIAVPRLRPSRRAVLETFRLHLRGLAARP